jgi:hypothetical protein
MEAADFGDSEDVTDRRRLQRPGIWRIFRQCQMGPCPMIVGEVSRQHAAQMRFADDEDVIEALAADGSDQSLHVRILPRTGRGRDDLSDSQTRDSAAEPVCT